MINLSLELKRKLYAQCLSSIQRKIDTAQKAMEEAQRAANEETKSSAGDKFETGRAMMQLEKNKYARQLAEALKTRQALAQVDVQKVCELVQPGAVVEADQGNFFIGVSAGKLKEEGQQYFAISLAAPLGQALRGAKAGDSVAFRSKVFKIKQLI